MRSRGSWRPPPSPRWRPSRCRSTSGTRGPSTGRCARARGFSTGMITNDVKGRGPGAGLYAALCSAQGKVLGDLRVLALDDALLLLCEASCRARVAQTLERFIIADDAKVTDATGEVTVLGCYGPGAAGALGRAARRAP